MSRGNTPENWVKRECLEYLNDIAALGGLAVVARSYRDIDQALKEAGYNGRAAVRRVSCRGGE